MTGLLGRRILTRNASVSKWGSMMKQTMAPAAA
jgi:hypothetical protein